MKKEKITFGDRIASSFVMLLASFLTALLIYGVVFYLSSRAGELYGFSYKFIVYFSAFFTMFAFIAPTKSLTTIGWLWGKIEKFFKSDNNGL